ncbi:MAG: hypothetical protein L0211_21885, partial [Planctomycetaceae bacterium]|nr:hypothetical protein [Planctomycetaceae bacterium]
EGRDDTLLKNIFYLEEPADSGKSTTRRKGKQPDDESGDLDDDNPPPPTGSPISVKKIAGGFSISSRENDGAPVFEIGVEVAYEVRRGNPFKKYERFDFALDAKPIMIAAEGATYQSEGNKLQVRPTRSDFSVKVTGFDTHRDLAIRAVPRVQESKDAQKV